jgi:hypothetical protein
VRTGPPLVAGQGNSVVRWTTRMRARYHRDGHD